MKQPRSPAQSTPRGERFRICEVPIVRVLLSSGTNAPDVWNLVRDAWAGTAKAVCGIWLKKSRPEVGPYKKVLHGQSLRLRQSPVPLCAALPS
jgi:hypothetical protein